MLFLAPQLGDSAKAKAQDLHLQHVHAQQARGRGGGEGVLVGAASGGKTAGRGERPWLAALRSTLLPRSFHPSFLLFLATFLKGRRRKKKRKETFLGSSLPESLASTAQPDVVHKALPRSSHSTHPLISPSLTNSLALSHTHTRTHAHVRFWKQGIETTGRLHTMS